MRVFGWFVLILVLFVVLGVFGWVANWFGRAGDVVTQQTDPAILLQRYEWFKDVAATLDAKKADIAVYQSREKAAHCDAVEDRTSREQCMVWLQETAGIIASYNDLAKDYNANMSKINWAFTNVGSLQVQGPFLHREGDDDSAAVTFWGKQQLRAALQKALDLLDEKMGYQGPQPIIYQFRYQKRLGFPNAGAASEMERLVTTGYARKLEVEVGESVLVQYIRCK